MNFRKFITILSLIIELSFSQTFSSAYDFSLGNSTVSNIFTNSFGQITNPSLSNFQKQIETGIYYTPGLFNLEELAIFGYSLNYPINNVTNIGFAFYNNSFSLYKKNYFNFNLSYFFDALIIPGINIAFDYVDVKNYKSDYKIVSDFGITSLVNSNLSFGFVIKNLFKTSHYKNDNDITHKYQLGLSYYLDNYSLLSLSVEKELYQKVNFAAGTSLKLVDFLYLNIGYQNNPSLQNYGFTLFIDNFSLEYALSIHNILGNTHHISLYYSTDLFINKYHKTNDMFLK